jgi:hypothetical protein
MSSIGRWNLRDINKKKKYLDFETSNSTSEVSKSNLWKNYFFLKNYITSEGAVSNNVLYYQPLPITRYQEMFYAIKYFE